MSLQSKIVEWAIKRKFQRKLHMGATLFGAPVPCDMEAEELVQRVRCTLDEAVSSLPKPVRGTSVQSVIDSTVRGEWIASTGVPLSSARVILYFHGGGFFWGNLAAPRNMLSRLSGLSGARIFSLDYSLAPEFPFPNALDDAITAYSWLMEEAGIEPEQIVIGGESSGGGLALSLLCALPALGLPNPGAAFLFSPWTDLELRSPSIEKNAKADFVLNKTDLQWAAELYLNGNDPHSERASPLYSDHSTLPQVLVQVSSSEILFNDSTRLLDRPHADKTFILSVWPRLHHVWQLHSYFLPEGRRALEQTADFIKQTVSV